jgi:hypothetical protein
VIADRALDREALTRTTAGQTPRVRILASVSADVVVAD